MVLKVLPYSYTKFFLPDVIWSIKNIFIVKKGIQKKGIQKKLKENDVGMFLAIAVL